MERMRPMSLLPRIRPRRLAALLALPPLGIAGVLAAPPGTHGPGAPFSLSGGALADAFHTFSVDWGPDSVTFAVDGTVYERRTPADTRGNPWVFNHPFFLLMDLAVGGGFPGNPDGSTSFPQQLVVDYVHVFAW